MLSTQKTTGEIIEYWRTLPEKRQLIENIYYDEDVLAAALRYASSQEFKAILEIAHKQGLRSGNVLDVGGGNGVAALAWHFNGYSAYLAEPDMSNIVGIGALLPVLEQQSYEISSLRAVGETLPFADGSFDIVFGRQVLHHMSDLKRACSEIRRVLAPNGICIIVREHVISRSEDLSIFLEKHALHKYTKSEHAYLLSEYLDAFAEARFRSVTPIGPLESIINYFPSTDEEHHNQVVRFLRKYVGGRIALRIANIGFVKRLASKKMSDKLNSPGRLYSFVARGVRS